MKILRIVAKGLALYKDTFDVSFIAARKVAEKHKSSVFHLFNKVYLNKAEAFVGLNASGKTIALKVIAFAMSLLEAKPMLAENCLGDNEVEFDIYFYSNKKIYRLNSKIKQTTGTLRILSETLFEKTVNSKMNKQNIFCFEGIEPIRSRDENNDYLPDNISIMIAYNKQNKEDVIYFSDLHTFTNFNLIPFRNFEAPKAIINLLDPTVEYIKIEELLDNDQYQYISKLKFYDKKEITLYSPEHFNFYLSSGTVKGIFTYVEAIKTLFKGGYLIIDEIENHFNKTLVAYLIRLFLDKETNPKGASIIFTTHYAELLDEFDRDDMIFIARNNQGLTVNSLFSEMDRHDFKKSEIFQSNYLGGTAPKYSAIQDLREYIIKSLERENGNRD